MIWICAAFAQSPQGIQPDSSKDIDEVSRCETLTNSTERLICFREATKSKIGAWKIRTSASKSDDSTSFYLHVEAKDQITGWPGISYTPIFILRCVDGKTDAFIDFGMTTNAASTRSSNDTTLEFRIDRQSPFKTQAFISTDGKAFFLSDPIAFAKRLLHANQLFVRFVPFNSAPQDTSFRVAGLENAIQPLMDACRWVAPKQGPAQQWVHKVPTESRPLLMEGRAAR